MDRQAFPAGSALSRPGSLTGPSEEERRACEQEEVLFPGLGAGRLSTPFGVGCWGWKCLLLWGCLSGMCMADVRACLCVNRADGMWKPCDCEVFMCV